MSFSFILERAVDVQCWIVEGSVARPVKRPELLPILLRVREVGWTDAADVAEHLLFDSNARRQVAQRMLYIAVRLGLLVEDTEQQAYALSADGELALERGEIFVPEHGVWQVWITEDPLLPAGVVHAEPWSDEASAFDEVRGDERDALVARRFQQIPLRLSQASNLELESVVGIGRLRIVHLQPKGERIRVEAALRVRWEVAARRVRLEGKLLDRDVSSSLEAPVGETEGLWKELLASADLLQDWDAAAGALRVAFANTQPLERQAMARDLLLSRPRLPRFGVFEDLTVRGVSLVAATARDARDWARWRLNARVSDYATSERFASWVKDAVAPFRSFALVMPTRSELAREAWAARGERPTPSVWNLVAAEDWRL